MVENNITPKENFPQSVFLSYLDLLQSRASLFQSRNDPEDLHQLRTTCRRLRNALWIYKNAFSKSKLKSWDQSLKGLAKIAGVGRDLDVHLIFLNDYQKQNKESSELHQELIEDLRKRRGLAQSKIIQSLSGLIKEKTLAQIKSTVSKIEYPKEKLLRLAEKKISKQAKAFLKYKKFAEDETNSKQLHNMRIAAKHLRYTLESFESLYGSKLAEFTQTIHAFQQTLGQVHDLDVWTVELLSGQKRVKSSSAPSLLELKSHCLKLRGKVYGDFIEIWKTALKNDLFNNLKKFLKSYRKGT